MDRAEYTTGEKLDAIRAALADGSLPMAALERAVEECLGAELKKPAEAVDTNFVEACNAILWDIYAARNPDCPEQEGPRVAQILATAKAREPGPRRRRLALRAIAMVPVVIVGMFVGDVLLGDSRMTIEQSIDEQQVIFQVQPEASGMIDKSTAEGGDFSAGVIDAWPQENWVQPDGSIDPWPQEDRMDDGVLQGDWNGDQWQGGQWPDEGFQPDGYHPESFGNPAESGHMPPPSDGPPPNDFVNVTTTDLSIIHAVLGYIPPMPSWIPEYWHLMEYNATRFADSTSFHAVYETPGERYILRYSYERFGPDTSASVAYEQDAQGEWVTTPGGTQVYRTTNIDISVLLWKSGSTLQSVSGPVPHDILMRMVDSL